MRLLERKRLKRGREEGRKGEGEMKEGSREGREEMRETDVIP